MLKMQLQVKKAKCTSQPKLTSREKGEFRLRMASKKSMVASSRPAGNVYPQWPSGKCNISEGNSRSRSGIHIPAEGILSSFKSAAGVRNKAVVYSRPLMRRGSVLFRLPQHNKPLERDAAKSSGAPQLYRYVKKE